MLNKIMIIGHLGKDPERKNENMVIFSVAVGEKYKDKNGSTIEKVIWFNCVAFNKTAELCEKYLNKGSKVLVEGKISENKVKNELGEERSYYNVVIDKVHFLDTIKKENNHEHKKELPSAPDFNDDIPF